MSRFGTLGVLALLALGTAQSVSAANVAFASFIPTTTGANVRYEKTGTASGAFYTIDTPTSSSAGSTDVRFSFLDPVLSSLGVLDARWTNFAATADNSALSIGGLLIQNVDSGTKQFTYTGTAPLVVGTSVFTTGANLLTATFTNGFIFGVNGSSAGSVTDSRPNGTLTFTSDFLTFSNAGSADIALALSAISPSLNRLNPDSSIAGFRAVAAGVFSTEVLPSVGPGIPEPSVWAMLIAGYLMVGTGIRRRRVVAVNA